MNNDFILNTPNPRYQAAFRRPTSPRPQSPPEPPEAPSAPEDFPPARKKPSPVPIIICILLAIAGITFGVIEFLKNSELKTEIEDLKTKISGLETKPEEKPEKPTDKKYSGTSKFEFSSKLREGMEVPADTPTIDYSIDLNFDTGELLVKAVVRGNCKEELEGPGNCGENDHSLVLTDKELGKIWQIMQKEDFKEIEILSTYASLHDRENETLESILTTIVQDDKKLAAKESTDTENWAEVSDYDTDNDDILTYREYSNKILDDILFEIYGWANCMPTVDEDSITNCDSDNDNCIEARTDCLSGPEGTDCEVMRAERKLPPLDCKTAEEIGYPYIAY